MEENIIYLQGNGAIVIQDAQSGNITINSNEPMGSLQELQRLNDTQIAILKKLADKHASELNDTFKTLLSGVISRKNIVQGNISNVKSFKIGDETHYHYHNHTEKHPLPKELTAIVPKTSQDKIIGRDAELEDLHQRLFNNKQVVLVNGLGGIGKTTLAQAYTAKYWDEYCHIAYVSQISKDIISDFISTEGLLGSLNIFAKDKDPRGLFITIIAELKKMEDSPNLLIIDNADRSLSQLYNYLPSQPQWHILVTSRERIQRFDLKELGFLSEPDAVTLFLRHFTHGKMTEDEIKELVRAVDFHTLTIEILAKTAQLQRTEMKELKSAIEDDLKANVYINHKGNKIEKVTSYLCSIFSMSQLSDSEIWLLQQFICLPAEFHSYELVKDMINPAATQKEDNFSETIEELSAKGWLLKNRETDSYKMHRIIADVIKKQHTIALTNAKPVIDSITAKLSIDQTKDNPVEKFPWIPFGKSALAIFPDSSDPVIAKLQNNLATVLQDLGDYEGAKSLLEKALSSAEKNFGPEHPTTAVRYSNLALVLKDLGDYEGALKLSEKSLRIVQKVLPQGHPHIKIVSDIYQSIKQQINK